MDDGPRSIATSLAMAQIAAEDGISVVIATPHADGSLLAPEQLAAAVANLNRELSTRTIPLTVVSGFEVPHHLALDLAVSHTLAASRYLLIEFPHDFMPAEAAPLIRDLVARGYLPIVAHPERNGDILADPRHLSEIVDAGAQSQVTAASVTGDFGPDCQRCSHFLLTRGLAHFIATDSHSPTFRIPVLSKARSLAEKLLGPERAALLVEGNPRKILRAASPPPR
jgi:protein-tyrosine phosphatase